MSINTIWLTFRWRLFFIAFFPFALHILSYSIYLVYFFKTDRDRMHSFGFFSNFINLVYGLLQLYIEGKQVKLMSYDYWLGPNAFWNYLQHLGYLSAMTFSILDIFTIVNDNSMFFFWLYFSLPFLVQYLLLNEDDKANFFLHQDDLGDDIRYRGFPGYFLYFYSFIH